MRRLPVASKGLRREWNRRPDRVRQAITGTVKDSDNRVMAYQVKEIIYTLQGEGAQSGRAAVFCRFAACNLWSGHDADRASAVCQFCDTDFLGTDGPHGGEFATARDLADAVARQWAPADREHPSSAKPLVVCTGGEPLLQLDASLVDCLHE